MRKYSWYKHKAHMRHINIYNSIMLRDSKQSIVIENIIKIKTKHIYIETIEI